MDWVPITRDGCMFTLNVLALIATTWDGYMHWYEAVILVSFSIPYFIIVFQSPRISRFMKRKFEDEYACCCCSPHKHGLYSIDVMVPTTVFFFMLTI